MGLCVPDAAMYRLVICSQSPSPWVYNSGSGGNSNYSYGFIAIDQSGTSNAFGRVGWIEYPLGTRHSFLWYGDGSTTTYDGSYTAQSTGTSTWYKVLYDHFGNAELSFWVAGSEIGSQVPVTWTPTRAKSGTRTNNYATQIAGATGSGHETTYDTSQIYTIPNGWTDLNGTTSVSDSVFTSSKQSSQLLYTRDQDCSS